MLIDWKPIKVETGEAQPGFSTEIWDIISWWYQRDFKCGFQQLKQSKKLKNFLALNTATVLFLQDPQQGKYIDKEHTRKCYFETIIQSIKSWLIY